MKYLYFTHTYSFVEIYTKGNINALEINVQINHKCIVHYIICDKVDIISYTMLQFIMLVHFDNYSKMYT